MTASATITAQELAEMLGVSTWAVYESAKAGTCPVEPIKVGRRLVWSRARVEQLLGIEAAA
jgi:predicted DNA-binding transcriptional regulator AlpA